MTREEAQELLPVIQAFAEGKAIQSRAFRDGYWYDVDSTNDIDWDAHEYRVKPELKYRPFKNADECWAEMLKHQPFGWLCWEETFYSIDFIDNYGTSRKGNSMSYYDVLRNEITFADGTPFGIKEGGEE